MVIILQFCVIGLIIGSIGISTSFLFSDGQMDFGNDVVPIVANDVDELIKSRNLKG